MKSASLKLTTILLIVIVGITLTASNIGPLQSRAWASSGESIGVGALVILGAWGGYKLFSSHQADKYNNYLANGQQYLEAGNYGLAIKDLEQAKNIKDSVEVNQLLTEAKSNYQQQHYQQGQDYLDQENWEAAYRSFKKVAKYGDYLDNNLKQEEAYKKLRQEKLKRVAVIEFEDNSYQYDLGTRTTGFLISDLLSLDPDFLEIVEREKLSTILKEQKLQSSGLITSSTAQEIGNLVGADYLLVGKVISGEVSRDKVTDVLTKEEGEEVEKIRVEKEAYVEVLFKLVNVADGSVVVSKSFEETENYHESYFEDETEIITSDEKLLNRVLKQVTARFSNIIVKKYSLTDN